MESPIKKDFNQCTLKQKTDPERDFLIDLRKVASPMKKKKENRSPD
jgi:hypothetical protein